MKIDLHAACLTMVVCAVALATSPARAQSSELAGNADSGHQLFDSVGCYECHGYAGQGGGSAGPRLAKTKLPFEAFLMQLRTPANQMPPYEAVVLPDDKAADIYAYIESLPAPVNMETVTLPH
jgi:ubiquinol-cytochrome c reductase cytochrome c subunit